MLAVSGVLITQVLTGQAINAGGEHSQPAVVNPFLGHHEVRRGRGKDTQVELNRLAVAIALNYRNGSGQGHGLEETREGEDLNIGAIVRAAVAPFPDLREEIGGDRLPREGLGLLRDPAEECEHAHSLQTQKRKNT